MKHKKIGVILLSSLVIASGCASNNVDNSPKETKESSQEMKSEEAILLEKLRLDYEGGVYLERTLKSIDETIPHISDENLKKEYLKLANDTAKKVLESSKGYILKSQYETLTKLYNTYGKYLDSELKQAVEEELNASSPAEERIKKYGYIVESLNEFDGIQVGDFTYNTEQLLKERNIEVINLDSNTIIASNRGIRFDIAESKVKKIFVIKDKNGKLLNPLNIKEFTYEIDEIAKIDDKRTEEQDSRHRENIEKELAKREKEQQEAKTIRIGMTTDEVRSRWGEPNDINRTITAHGTREQWVYGGGNYLYFEDGILTAIQN